MRTHISIMALAMALFLVVPSQAKDVNITTYGARKSTKRVCTEAIQRAIDDCHKSGGGKVIVPQGKFTTGAIVLKSGVTLYLEEGATLLGSKKPADYVLNKKKAGVTYTSQLIFAYGATTYNTVPILKGEMFFGPAIFAIALLVCCVLNVLAATLPAWLSLRRPIVESMMIKK